MVVLEGAFVWYLRMKTAKEVSSPAAAKEIPFKAASLPPLCEVVMCDSATRRRRLRASELRWEGGISGDT